VASLDRGQDNKNRTSGQGTGGPCRSRPGAEASMSGGSEQPRPPRRPKSAARPIPTPTGDDAGEAPSVFRANPRQSRTARGSGATPEDLGPGESPGFFERILYGRVGSGQLATFCRQLAAYLNAGVDLNKALVNLQRQFAGTALGLVIGRLQSGVKRGSALTELVTREPQAFDPLFVGMIGVAEQRGGVPETLRLLSRHYEARQRLMRQARSAMIYPIAVLTVAAAVVALLTVWLLPMFASLLRHPAGRAGGALPPPRRALIALA